MSFINIGKLLNNILMALIFLMPIQVFTKNVLHIPTYIQIYYAFIFLGVLYLILNYIKYQKLHMNKFIFILYGMFFVISIISSVYNYNNVVDIKPDIYNFQVVTYTPFWDRPMIRTWYFSIFRTGLLYLFIIIVYNFLSSHENIRKVLKLFIILAFITSIYSIYQIFATKYGLPYGAIFSNRSEASVAQLFGIRRLDGLFFEPSPQAGFLSTIWCIVLSQLFEKNKQNLLFSKPNLTVLLVLSTGVMFLTFSPIGVLTPIIATPLFLIYYFKNNVMRFIRKNITFIILPSLIILVFSIIIVTNYEFNYFREDNVLGYIKNKIQISTVDLKEPFIYMNQDSRSVRNYAGLQMFLDHPVLGIGPGNSGFFYFSYIPFVNFSKMSNLSPLINVYICLLGENGLLGFVIFMILLLYPIYLINQYRISFNNNPLLLGLLCGYVIIVLITFLSYSYDKDPTFWIIYIIMIKSIFLRKQYIGEKNEH